MDAGNFFKDDFSNADHESAEEIANAFFRSARLSSHAIGSKPAINDSTFDGQSLTLASLQRNAPGVGSKPKHEENVSQVNREEIDVKLELLDVRLGARIQQVADLMAARDEQYKVRQEAHVAELAARDKLQADQIKNIGDTLADAASATDKIKSNIWFGVATTIGAVLAGLGLIIAAFDSGRETSKNIAEAAARMEKLQVQLEAQANRPIATPAVR